MPKGTYNIKYIKICKVCNSEYLTQRKMSTYCGGTCRNAMWRSNNRELYRQKQQKWIEQNPQRHHKNQYEYKKNRLKNDVEYKLRQRMRSRIGRIKYNNSIRTLEWLGCSISQLKTHLESKFLPGMSWDNYGKNGWHIDHIKPLSNFNLHNDNELKIACHYTNLQPLWWRDNLVKSNKI